MLRSFLASLLGRFDPIGRQGDILRGPDAVSGGADFRYFSKHFLAGMPSKSLGVSDAKPEANVCKFLF